MVSDATKRRLMLSGAMAFAQWCVRQPDDKVAEGVDLALAEFAKEIEAEVGAVMRVVVPQGWTAMPKEMTPKMLAAFQEGFMRELKRRSGRTQTAEQAGFVAAMRAAPALPDGWVGE